MGNFGQSSRPSRPRRYSAMGLGMVLVFFAFWYLWSARLNKPASSAEVIDVTPETFAQTASQGKPGILEFYTSACPWCAKIEPELAKVNDEFGDEVFVVKMNAEKHYTEAVKYKLSGVPTLVFFDPKGAATAIASGYRDCDEIVEILKNYKFVK